MPTFCSKFPSLKVSESVLPYLDLEVDPRADMRGALPGAVTGIPPFWPQRRRGRSAGMPVGRRARLPPRGRGRGRGRRQPQAQAASEVDGDRQLEGHWHWNWHWLARQKLSPTVSGSPQGSWNRAVHSHDGHCRNETETCGTFQRDGDGATGTDSELGSSSCTGKQEDADTSIATSQYSP